LVGVGEDPDSLPEPEHLNKLQTPYDLATDRLALLLAYLKKMLFYSSARYVESLMKTSRLHIFVMEPSHSTRLVIPNKYLE